MTPTLLILATSPTPGTAYAITPIIGGGQARTAVYRGPVHREEVVTISARDGLITYRYQYELGQFIDPATGEIFEREVEVFNQKEQKS